MCVCIVYYTYITYIYNTILYFIHIQNQSSDQYARAGGLSTESLSAIRTVTALNAQPEVVYKYNSYLNYAMRVRGWGILTSVCI